jgi:hypothetical protein
MLRLDAGWRVITLSKAASSQSRLSRRICAVSSFRSQSKDRVVKGQILKDQVL